MRCLILLYIQLNVKFKFKLLLTKIYKEKVQLTKYVSQIDF